MIQNVPLVTVEGNDLSHVQADDNQLHVEREAQLPGHQDQLPPGSPAEHHQQHEEHQQNSENPPQHQEVPAVHPEVVQEHPNQP